MSFGFKMPIRTPILAADDGHVFVVVEQFRDNIDNGFNEANLVGGEHADGILTWYGRLMFEGSLVQIDDPVLRGEVFGFCGITGASSYDTYTFSPNS